MATYTIKTTDAVFDGDSEGVVSGDTVLITSGTRIPLKLDNINGAAGNPVIVVNSGGVVDIDANLTSNWTGLQIEDCEHVRISGRGHARKYGIKLRNHFNSGLLAWKGTRYIEIENIEVDAGLSGDTYHTGFWVGTRVADVDPFTTFDINIHDCYIHDQVAEAMYLNHSSDQANSEQPIDGLDVVHCVCHGNGWESIQVRNADDVQVRGNEIWDGGKGAHPGTQVGAGIVLGANATNMEVWRNWIYDHNRGIAAVKQDTGCNVHHNLIDDCSDEVTDKGIGIYVTFRDNGILIEHNTVLNCDTYGLRSSAGKTDGIAKNNIFAGNGTNISTSFSEFNNTTGAIAAMNFRAGDDYYHLTSTSPAVGAADDGADNGWVDYN